MAPFTNDMLVLWLGPEYTSNSFNAGILKLAPFAFNENVTWKVSPTATLVLLAEAVNFCAIAELTITTNKSNM